MSPMAWTRESSVTSQSDQTSSMISSLPTNCPARVASKPQHRPGARTQGDDVAAFVAQRFTGQIHGPVADDDRMLR